MKTTKRKFYIVVENIITNILKREAITVRIQSSWDIDKSLVGKNIRNVKEISKEKFNSYYKTGHVWVSGQLISK